MPGPNKNEQEESRKERSCIRTKNKTIDIRDLVMKKAKLFVI
jgi:hypothetical protein